jgi:hypothetical protein
MRHAQALRLAEEALNAIAPSCERILIAGSIRRLKPVDADPAWIIHEERQVQ